MRSFFGVVLCAAATVGAMGVTYDSLINKLGWDDQYSGVLAALEKREGKAVAAEKIRMIQLARVTSPENPARQAMKKEVSELGEEPSSSFRLEYGNANLGSYGVVWALATPREILLITVRGQSIKRRHLDRDAYSTLWDRLESLKAWELESDADLYFDDGSVYFLSLFADGKVHQAAIYAPPRYGQTASERSLVSSADRFAQAIRELLALIDR
jgi:hypothetical protein